MEYKFTAMIKYLIPYEVTLIFVSFLNIVGLLIAIAFYTLAERKVMAAMQRRRGPDVVGYVGLLQPLADGLKLAGKETLILSKEVTQHPFIFLAAPVITFALSLMGWCIIPFHRISIWPAQELGALFLLAISSLGVYGIIFAGWASNSRYALLGAVRSAAQMISYEVAIGFIIIIIGMAAGSFNLVTIIDAQQDAFFCFSFAPLFLMFLVCILAETNRVPFDLPEAEAEIVAGYNIEYSALIFAMFFLGEYSNMLLMSALTAIYFLGGWVPFFAFFGGASVVSFIVKLLIIAFFFIWARATLPRYRYDQLLHIGWKQFLPVTLGYLIFIFCFLVIIQGLPFNEHALMVSHFI